jgi:N-acetyl-anhydromuramyl-L-alanine amidase AmpD
VTVPGLVVPPGIRLTNRLLEWGSRVDRPALTRVDGIVVHAMGERIGGKSAWEHLRDAGVDAHRLIALDGSIVQCIADDRVAYHTGKSRHGRAENLNRSTRGVELLVAGDHDWGTFVRALRGATCPFTPAQFTAVTWCCRDWVQRDPTITYILGHEHVSGPWVREDPKPDPGPWLELGRLWQDVWGGLPVPTRSING